jgi:anti-sigma factor RsiW
MSEHSPAIPNEWLTAYYDGELDEVRREKVEAHLLTCVSCQQELAMLRSLSDVLAVDPLPEGVLASRSEFWRKLESQLPDRAPIAQSPLRWLPGIGLLLINGLVQFGAAVSAVVMLIASFLPQGTQPLTLLSRAAASSVMGWITWLLPNEWSGLGLAAFFIVISACLAVLYLAWLGYMWRYRWPSAVRMVV